MPTAYLRSEVQAAKDNSPVGKIRVEDWQDFCESVPFLTSEVASGGVAHYLDTDATFLTGKLLQLKNAGVEKFYVDYAGNIVISGNLTVNGDFTVVGSAVTADLYLTLNNDYSAGAPTENAGLRVRRGASPYAGLFWDETNDRFRVCTSTDGTLGGTLVDVPLFASRFIVDAAGSYITSNAGSELKLSSYTDAAMIIIGNAQGGPSPGIGIVGAIHAGYSTELFITGGGTYADAQTGGDLKLTGGSNYSGGTNAHGGQVYVFGGVGSGSGTHGNVHLGYNGTTALGVINAYVQIRGVLDNSAAVPTYSFIGGTSTGMYAGDGLIRFSIGGTLGVSFGAGIIFLSNTAEPAIARNGVGIVEINNGTPGVFRDLILRDIEIDGALNHDGSTVGFYGTAPIAKQTGVAVDTAAVHAALVALGLIAA